MARCASFIDSTTARSLGLKQRPALMPRSGGREGKVRKKFGSSLPDGSWSPAPPLPSSILKITRVEKGCQGKKGGARGSSLLDCDPFGRWGVNFAGFFIYLFIYFAVVLERKFKEL